MKLSRPLLISLGMALVAFLLRLPGLSGFLTPDENLWSGRTAQFLMALSAHDWAATNITGHPGVTTVWAGTLGLLAKWLLARPAGVESLSAMVALLAADPVRLDFLPWLRLPIVFAGALGIAGAYRLALRFLSPVTALGVGLLLVLDPFLLAHTRVLQLDGLVTITLTLTLFALLAALRSGSRPLLALAGVFYGLAALTKSPALAAGPFFAGVLAVASWRAPTANRSRPANVVTYLAMFGAPALLTIFVLWPALWVAPVQTLGRVWGLMNTYGQGSHELGNYWLGQAADSPGAPFYGAVLLWRSSPLMLAGLLLIPAWLWLKRSPGRSKSWQLPPISVLALYVLWFTLILSTGDKKFDRYLLPVFPALDAIAAISWVGVMASLGQRLTRARPPSRAPRVARTLRIGILGLVAVLAALQTGEILSSRPSYLTAYNPLTGGIGAARGTMLIGWGEGLEEAAAYLNARPHAAAERTATWYGHNVFAPFYRGRTYDLFFDTLTPQQLYAEDIDHVVTYINQEQRDLVDPQVWELLGTPVYRVRRDGVDLASVYTWPKPFPHTADLRLGDGLRLLGWSLGAYDPQQGLLPITVYLDARDLREAPADRPIVAWVKDPAGEVWATREVAADAVGEKVRAWGGREGVVQDLTLDTPAALAGGAYRVEIAQFGGESASLGEVDVAPSGLTELSALDALDVPDVRFGGSLKLAGYTVKTEGGELVLDLLWAADEDVEGEYSVFVHLVGPGEQIAAQADLPLLPDSPSSSTPVLRGGEVMRRRARLTLPREVTSAEFTVYVGVYRRSDGARLPALVRGSTLPDGRYPLAAWPEN